MALNADAWVDDNIGSLSQLSLADVLRAWDAAKQPAVAAPQAQQAQPSASYYAGRAACAEAVKTGTVKRMVLPLTMNGWSTTEVLRHAEYVRGWNDKLSATSTAVFNVGE